LLDDGEGRQISATVPRWGFYIWDFSNLVYNIEPGLTLADSGTAVAPQPCVGPGQAYMKLEDNDKAIEALRKSLEINPDNTAAKGRLKTLGVE
jgi:tetratricopeptide (TPR) repeat protein